MSPQSESTSERLRACFLPLYPNLAVIRERADKIGQIIRAHQDFKLAISEPVHDLDDLINQLCAGLETPVIAIGPHRALLAMGAFREPLGRAVTALIAAIDSLPERLRAEPEFVAVRALIDPANGNAILPEYEASAGRVAGSAKRLAEAFGGAAVGVQSVAVMDILRASGQSYPSFKSASAGELADDAALAEFVSAARRQMRIRRRPSEKLHQEWVELRDQGYGCEAIAKMYSANDGYSITPGGVRKAITRRRRRGSH